MSIQSPALTMNLSKIPRRIIIELGLNATVLDLGSGRRRLAQHVINLDIEANALVDVVGDGHQLPVKGGVFDAVIVTGVIEHVREPKIVVDEIFRVLRSGGCVYAEIPFLQGYHSDPNDYQRFTIQGIDLLFGNFDVIEKGVAVGPSSALLWIFREYVGLFMPGKSLRRLARFAISCIVWPIKYLDFFVVRNERANVIACAFYILGKKKSTT